MNVMASLQTGMIMAQGYTPGHNVDSQDSWDLETFFTNAASYTEMVGGSFLAFIGMVAVLWGGFLLVRKLMGGPQNQDNWLKIVALLIVGGAMIFGGMALLLNFAKGGGTTIEGFGSGSSQVGG